MKCCVINCGAMYEKIPQLSLHRFPNNEALRQKWINSIGSANIDRSAAKHLHVCSLHFEDSCFNRTLGTLRLIEGAIPTIFCSVGLKSRQSLQEEQQQQMVTESEHCYSKSMARHEGFLQEAQPVLTDVQDFKIWKVEHEPSAHIKQMQEIQLGKDKIRKLKARCEQQVKKIKCLNEKCRRQAKQLAEYQLIMKELKNKEYIVIINTNK